ncbi:hypothetical protein BZG36_00605 [Bifiguratus adelaidae]|uniref:HIT-type domain-containing protein n=1 Tax=Bifiguratus adelaidae TaxID=1938954 RepID=A0A261Y7A9_9FUNG|nr:hypothetical protein BZG36_00605 [Bifiguratus adelaidae]
MATRKTERRTARIQLDPEAQRRQTERHLASLEQDNYQPLQDFDIAALATSGLLKGAEGRGSRKGFGIGHSRALFSKKNLNILLEESQIAHSLEPTYLTASASPSRYPPRHFCSVCGFQSKYTCIKCGMKYCSTKCLETHEETRCLKFTM